MLNVVSYNNHWLTYIERIRKDIFIPGVLKSVTSSTVIFVQRVASYPLRPYTSCRSTYISPVLMLPELDVPIGIVIVSPATVVTATGSDVR